MQTTHNENKRKKVFLITTLLLALLLIFAFGTYSLSKYVSQDKGSGTATIAKWGYTMKVDAANLFGQKYQNTDTSSLATVTENDDNLVVKASGETNVIAPGTTGYMRISVEGEAEIAAKLAFAIDNVKMPKLVVTRTVETDKKITYIYEPVTFQVLKYNDDSFTSGTAQNISTVEEHKTVGTLADVQTYFQGETFNKSISAASEETLGYYYDIVWEWKFDNNGEITPTGDVSSPDTYKLSSDVLDTLFGIYADDSLKSITYTVVDEGKEEVTFTVDDSTVKDIGFDLTITLEQVQTNP